MHLSAPAYYDDKLLSAAHALEQDLHADKNLKLDRMPAL